MSIIITRRLALVGGGTLFVAPALAQEEGQAEREIVEKARLSVDAIRRDKDLESVNRLLPRAKAALVCPEMHKGGFLLGAEGGSGVLLGRGADGSWSAPAFYSLGSGSLGLQAGYEKSEVLLVVMTDKGLEQLLKNQVKLGADLSVAVGPKGGGLEAGTTLGGDVYSYARSKGAFAGVSLEGSVINSRESRNRSYYGKPATARDIVVGRKFTSTYAKGLQEALGRASA